jgi:hypothetical protein
MSDTGITFLQPWVKGKSAVVMVLSHQQVLILQTLVNANDPVSNKAFHAALWPKKEHPKPLTAAQRAGLSRSLRRLAGQGFIQQINRGEFILTDSGKSLADYLFNELDYWRILSVSKR